jgi:hypothetical protein
MLLLIKALSLAKICFAQTHHWERWIQASVCTSLADLKDQNHSV